MTTRDRCYISRFPGRCLTTDQGGKKKKNHKTQDFVSSFAIRKISFAIRKEEEESETLPSPLKSYEQRVKRRASLPHWGIPWGKCFLWPCSAVCSSCWLSRVLSSLAFSSWHQPVSPVHVTNINNIINSIIIIIVSITIINIVIMIAFINIIIITSNIINTVFIIIVNTNTYIMSSSLFISTLLTLSLSSLLASTVPMLSSLSL